MSMTVHSNEIREVKERLDALLANPCDETAINVTQAVRRVFRILGLFDEPVQEQAPPKLPAPVLAGSSKSSAARSYGFTGEMCSKPGCGSFRVMQTGTCRTCQDCGQNNGCG